MRPPRTLNVTNGALADAILAECSEPGPNGVRNGSNAKMKAMQQEIAQNHDIDLSLVRILKLRKVASTFPPDRRRQGVSLEGHIEAGTPEVLDEVIKNAPAGKRITREHIRDAKLSMETDGTEMGENAARDRQAQENRRQGEDQQEALRQLEQRNGEKVQLQQPDTDDTHSPGTESPSLPPPASRQKLSRPDPEALEQSARTWVLSHGFDPTAEHVKEATKAFVAALLVDLPA
jgi:hypothetical protein